MFEQASKNIDDALWKESGCTTELDYTEQTSWLPKQFLHPKFFFYALRVSQVKSLGYARHYRLLKELLVRYPNAVVQQSTIADGLDQLSEETQRLEALYQRKLEAMDELKQSLLHQAFSGQL